MSKPLQEAESDRRPPATGGPTPLIYRDGSIAAFIIALCAVIYYLSTRIDEVPVALAQGIQPASYPQGVLAFILVFTAGMLVEARSRPSEVPQPIPSLAYYTIAAMVISLAIATWVDFFLGMIFFVVICVPVWGMRRYLATVAYALALAAVLYVMFAIFLRVRFPSGVLIDRLS